MMKYSSSRKDVDITTAELFPMFSPSLLRYNMATDVPPMEDGVIAEVNSQSIIILNDFTQENFLSVRILNRAI